MLLGNLLIGQLPDAIGLMLFGAVMVLTSTVLRKLAGKAANRDQSGSGFEERV